MTQTTWELTQADHAADDALYNLGLTEDAPLALLPDTTWSTDAEVGAIMDELLN